MALQFKVSNSLSALAAELAKNLKAEQGSVFLPQYLVTQTTGMNNWLKMKTAELNGISANLRFLKPNDMIYQVYFKLGGQKNQVLSADHLQWVIFDLLNRADFTGKFLFIASYYPGGDELKRLGLATKVADLFDQYQIYRPEMIESWNNADTAAKDADWQCWLWNASREKLGTAMPDKTIILQEIRRSLQQPDRTRQLTERVLGVHLFGLSILTAYHIDFFYQLSEHIDVSFYLLNPSPDAYWYEDRSEAQIARWLSRQGGARNNYAPPILGNQLLTSWGRVLQDTFGLFFKHEEFLNQFEAIGVAPPEPSTLLGKIQFDIFNNAMEQDRQVFSPDDLKDQTVSINACYTPAREVEVLYNYLVGLVDQAAELYSPRDIVVMVTDIDAYAPYIKAIFGSAPYRFPYTIADESYQAVDGFFSTLQLIMELREDNFKAENVLQILELAYVKERFRIHDTELVRNVVRAANIRFGIRGETSDDSYTLSWLNGLNRIIYGICMRSEDEYMLNETGFYPLDIVEGAQAFELIRFSHFVRVLISMVTEQSRPRPLSDWCQYLREVVTGLMYEPDGEENPEFDLFNDQLERLNLVAGIMQEPVSFTVFRKNFVQLLSGESRAGAFMSGGITFCSLIPMRSIPFKVVALLGLNFDKFPRKELPLSFNLIEKQRRRGDRNIKENDRHLFLETVLSARDRLYISYIGRSQKDNSLIPPSALVDELVDYVGSGLAEPSPTGANRLTRLHPLHSFSHLYADPDSGLVSYFGEAIDNPKGFSYNEQAAAPDIDFASVAVQQLLSFYKYPVKYYYNKILGVYYGDDSVLLPETELFELDHLQQWALKQALVLIPQEEWPAFRQKEVKTGQLPLNTMAELAIEASAEQVAPVLALLAECMLEGPARNAPVRIDLAETTISGSLTQVYGNKQLVTCFSKKEEKHRLDCYLRHLLATAAGLGLETYFISGVTAEVSVLRANLLTVDEAKGRLEELLVPFISGHQQPYLFATEFLNKRDTIAGLDDAGFDAFLDRAIYGGQSAFIHDEYLIMEYDGGFFDSPGTCQQLTANINLIYGPVPDSFQSI
ncbi:exodeoxyribonuclease V subunit gamma [Mucilaginibacter sp. HC2]|uniref:exodeoxyribonuclease V subunit gamma n=1 Tax=Mucilaginibacter inviolabilis TaxID=2714892 RepID=UPI00140E7334|nr:exodeoxyribonuclease V subunit gamma [Mucilaginibacter inviolabilis]NHA03469.1 exodeoxyribonuclease V subunit gamma [Mucilaginibacter inviolabilis]